MFTARDLTIREAGFLYKFYNLSLDKIQYIIEQTGAGSFEDIIDMYLCNMSFYTLIDSVEGVEAN